MRVLFMPSAPGNPYLDLLAGGLAQHGVQVRMARGSSQAFPIMQAAARGSRPDVLHLHWTQPYLYWPSTSRMSRLLGWRLLLQLRLLRRLGIRLVWTVHNIAAHESDAPEMELRLSRSIARLADMLIVHCAAARQTAIETLDSDATLAEKLVVIPHGNYLGAYADDISRNDARSGLGLGPDQTVFLFFGRLRRYKGAGDLLEAFRAVPDPNARLILAGKCRGEDVRRDVEKQAQRDPRVLTRLEYVPDEEVQRYMRAADVAVLPFRDVLTSGSAVLAMSFGLPVIAPHMGCLPETLAGQHQLLYDPAGPDALGRALAAALTADLRALGAANRAAVEPLTWDRIAAETIRLAYGGTPART